MKNLVGLLAIITPTSVIASHYGSPYVYDAITQIVSVNGVAATTVVYVGSGVIAGVAAVCVLGVVANKVNDTYLFFKGETK